VRLHDVEKSDRYYASFEVANKSVKIMVNSETVQFTKKVTTYNEEKVVAVLINLTKNIHVAPSEFAIF